MLSPDVAIVGPYIVHNFGDDLIGAVLAKYLGTEHGLRSAIPGLSRPNADWLGCEWSDSAVKAVMAARGVVVGGGGILGDSGKSPGSNYLWRGVRAATLARLRGKPVVVTGVGAGPLQLAASRRLCRLLCRLATHVGVRDRESLEFLQGTIGVPGTKLTLGADAALLWPELLGVVPVPNGLVGVQCDAAGFASAQSRERVQQVYRRLADWTRAHRAESVLVSNGRNDTSLARWTPGILHTLRYERLADFLPHLAGLRSIITTHLHLSIAAYTARVPCFTIFVREKTVRFYRQIGRPERAVSIETASVADIERLLDAAQAATWTAEDEERRTVLCSEARKLMHVMDVVAA
jgi:polysaccharide pyruvyl transferase WcaK-like protein